MSLADIRTKSKQKPPRLVVYGGAGIGKTTFGASMPKPIFILTEDGMGKIEASQFPLCPAWDKEKEHDEDRNLGVLQRLKALIEEDHDYKTVVIDSLDWLEPMIWDKACQDNGWKSIEQPGYGKGYVEVLKYWRVYIDLLNTLREEKGMIILQIAHNQIKRFESPEIEAFDRHELKLHRKAADLILEHSDVLLSTLIDTINPDNNDLPIDGLNHLIAINQDCKDLIKYLNDYHSYDPG
mgnify:CR=1 FL=1